MAHRQVVSKDVSYQLNATSAFLMGVWYPICTKASCLQTSANLLSLFFTCYCRRQYHSRWHGKTPFVRWLSLTLHAMGFKPGIILRGVGKRTQQPEPIRVTAHSKAIEVGDEALLLAKNNHACVIVSSDRTKAAKLLEQIGNCNIIISDDGLQHYALQRDIEIVLFDAKRQFGNKRLLPSGPLREPVTRLKEVDFIVENGVEVSQLGYAARYVPRYFVSVKENNGSKPLDYFSGKKVHAVAGIGHPQSFFALLEQLGIEVVPHIFPDHYIYSADDLMFSDAHPIVMTEKDAVKCRELLQETGIPGDHWYYLAVQFECDARLESELGKKLAEKNIG